MSISPPQKATPAGEGNVPPADLFLRYRRRSGWSQSELGRRVNGLSERAVRNWEAGYNLPKPDALRRLIEVYLAEGVFEREKEREEASRLWKRVKSVFDDSAGRFEAYPAFDAAWFAQLVRERTPPASPGDLPPLPFALLERRQEAERIIAALEGSRLVTLTGAGGVGKTTLTLLVANALRPSFPDGVYFVALATQDAPDAPLRETARAAGVAEEADRPLLQTLCNHLGAKRSLLLLDNIEHLLEPCAALAWDLLHVCPEIKILASGRQAMGLREETPWRVPPLFLPDEEKEWRLQDLLSFESVDLFLQRARGGGAFFDLTGESALQAARICRRLDGIPLAIELAAAHAATMGVAALAERLEQDFSVLDSGGPDGRSRRQTMCASIAWSHRLATLAEQRLWRRLSVFTGGWTLAAAEAVCGGDSPLTAPGAQKETVGDTLAGLTGKSLVVAPEGGSLRYRFHETLRQFGAEKLQAVERDCGEETRTRDRHLDYFASWGEALAPALLGVRDNAVGGQIEADYPNLRSALAWGAAGAVPGRVLAGMRLANALAEFWHTRPYVSEGREQVTHLIGAARAAALSEAPEFARLLYVAGILAQSQSDLPDARRLLREALSGFERRSEGRGAADARRFLGFVAFDQGDYEEAEPHLARAASLYEQLGDKGALAHTLQIAGLVAAYPGDLDTATTRLEEGLRIAQEADAIMSVVRNQYGLAVVAALRGKYNEAERVLVPLLTDAIVSGHLRPAAYVAEQLGVIALGKGDGASALRYYQEAIRLARRVGLKTVLALALIGVANGLARFAPASVRERFERTALLCGAVSALLSRLEARLSPTYQSLFDRAALTARRAIGDTAYEAGFAEGANSPLENAVALALATL